MSPFEDDYKTFSKRGQLGDQDLWGQHLQNLIRNRLDDYALSLVTWQFHRVSGQDLARAGNSAVKPLLPPQPPF